MANEKFDQNQYEFIMNPGAVKQKTSLLGGMDNKKFLALAGGVVLLLLILVTVLFSGGGPSNSDLLLKVAQRQNELIRVAGVGVKQARGSEALNLARTVELNLRSDQSPLLAVLKAQKVKVGNKQLASPTAAETDKLLTEARQNNRFDTVFVTYIQSELQKYQQDLDQAYETSKNKELRDTLKLQYDNATILIGTEAN